MTSATPAVRTAAQLHEAAQEVARLAARRSGQNNLQVAVRAASQRLELATAKAEDLLFRAAREAQGGDSCDLFRQVCAELAEAARDCLRAPQLAERGPSPASSSGGFAWETHPGSESSPRS